MLSRKKVLSAIAGLAMLALPVSAFAGHHDQYGNWNHPRWHDQGFHKGWAKHQFVPPAVRAHVARAYINHRLRMGWEGRPMQRPWMNYGNPAAGPYAWNHGEGRGCDGDDDNCGWMANNAGPGYQPYAAPNYGGDQDGDENNGSYGNSPSWYQQMPPSSYNPSQQLSYLVARRQRAMATIAQLRARGDSKAAARLVPIVTALNQRIAALNRGAGYGNVGYGNAGYANAGYGYAPLASYMAPASPLLNPAPYAGAAYAGTPYYGAPYTGNPTVDALSSVVVPMLAGIH